MPKVAVVGCGDISIVHFEAIASIPGADLVAVADADPRTLDQAAERYGVPGFADHRQLLEAIAARRRARVHARMTNTPTVALDCLDAGVAVLEEKPLAHTVAEADRHRRAAGASGRQDRDLPAEPVQRDGDGPPASCSTPASSARCSGGSATVLWHRAAAYYQARPWRGRWPTAAAES